MLKIEKKVLLVALWFVIMNATSTDKVYEMKNSANKQADVNLIPSADWQTKYRGTNDQEYQIYKDMAEDLGWEVKTYDEWLNS